MIAIFRTMSPFLVAVIVSMGLFFLMPQFGLMAGLSAMALSVVFVTIFVTGYAEKRMPVLVDITKILTIVLSAAIVLSVFQGFLI